MSRRPGVVLSSVACDSHTWNLVYLQLRLEELGCDVVNLGACTPDALVAEALQTHRPDLLVVSSVNGHGAMDATRLLAELRGRGLLDATRAVVGGKLSVAGALAVPARDALLAAGAHEVLGEDAEALARIVQEVCVQRAARGAHATAAR